MSFNRIKGSEDLMQDELFLPWKVYFFGSDGKYDKDDVLTVYTTLEMQSPLVVNKIKFWNDAKLEIRVCDSMDYCILHYLDGERMFP